MGKIKIKSKVKIKDIILKIISDFYYIGRYNHDTGFAFSEKWKQYKNNNPKIIKELLELE